MMVRQGKRATLARKDTSIVIDGFLRSGNTFSVAAFAISNGRELHIGRHLHGAPHLLRAVRLGLPTVALIREPGDAVASYLVRRPTLNPDDALLEYLDFYRTAWRARDGFVVGLFDQVVSDFGAIVFEVNRAVRHGVRAVRAVAGEPIGSVRAGGGDESARVPRRGRGEPRRQALGATRPAQTRGPFPDGTASDESAAPTGRGPLPAVCGACAHHR